VRFFFRFQPCESWVKRERSIIASFSPSISRQPAIQALALSGHLLLLFSHTHSLFSSIIVVVVVFVFPRKGDKIDRQQTDGDHDERESTAKPLSLLPTYSLSVPKKEGGVVV
jgi:hypothetical protein